MNAGRFSIDHEERYAGFICQAAIGACGYDQHVRAVGAQHHRLRAIDDEVPAIAPRSCFHMLQRIARAGFAMGQRQFQFACGDAAQEVPADLA